jgi:DNA adenine methylase
MIKIKSYRSPLFYVGDKRKIISEIKAHFPNNIDRFIEPFVGGGSVFMNTEAKEYILNDIDSNIYNIHLMLNHYSKDKDKFFQRVIELINKYGLSKSFIEDVIPIELKKEYNKTYYAHYNKVAYNKLKRDYNLSCKNDYIHLYILLIYGFNRMMRINRYGDFNVPVGNVDFNNNVVNALNDYFDIVSKKNIQWYNMDYRKFIEKIQVNSNDFLYFDPPYLISSSEYNKYWTNQSEMMFCRYLNKLNQENIKFAVSNVIHYRGKTNTIFEKWAQNYNVHLINSNYISFNDNSNKEFKEVLVLNY